MLAALADGRVSTSSCSAPPTRRHGAIESRDEAKACAALFRAHRDEIDGVIVTLPNFGDERAVAETLRLAGAERAGADPRRGRRCREMGMRFAIADDSFCGKMSVCNVLTQYGIPYSLTTQHTQRPESATLSRRSAQLRRDRVAWCADCARARIGAIGARPAAFKTVRYSEKILEASGIAVEPIDLSEILGRIERLADDDAAVPWRSSPRCNDYVVDRRHPRRGADQDGEARRW